MEQPNWQSPQKNLSSAQVSSFRNFWRIVFKLGFCPNWQEAQYWASFQMKKTLSGYFSLPSKRVFDLTISYLINIYVLKKKFHLFQYFQDLYWYQYLRMAISLVQKIFSFQLCKWWQIFQAKSRFNGFVSLDGYQINVIFEWNTCDIAPLREQVMLSWHHIMFAQLHLWQLWQ